MSAQQLAGALTGLGKLYKFDHSAWDHFDKTAKGFWQSFIVALLLAPLSLAHRLLQFGTEAQNTSADAPNLGFVPFAIVEVLSYIITWVLFPFAMLYLARLLNRTPRYFAYMVPYLWMQLPIGLLLFSVQVLTDLQILPAEVFEIVNMLVFIAFAVYGSYVAAIGLQVGTGTALGLVVLDYVLGLLAAQLIAQI